MGIGGYMCYQSNWQFIKHLSTPDRERICMTEEVFLISWHARSLLRSVSLLKPICRYLYEQGGDFSKL